MSDMTEKDLLTSRLVLERDISVAIKKLTDNFQKDTGLSVWDISLNAVDKATIGEERDYVWSATANIE